MCLHYTVLHFQGDATIHQYFGQITLVTVAAMLSQLHFLVLAQILNFGSGEPSPEVIPKQHSHPIQIHAVWGPHIRLNEVRIIFEFQYCNIQWYVIHQVHHFKQKMSKLAHYRHV